MDKQLNDYINDINREYSNTNPTEHTFRPALKKLIESLKDNVNAANEPARIKCGAPDYAVTIRKRNLTETIGYIEAKDIGSNLNKIAKSDQIKNRYLPSLDNFILTDYIEFRWFVNGEPRLTAICANQQADGKFKLSPDGVNQLTKLLDGFINQPCLEISSSKELAAKLAHIARLLRDMIANTFDKETNTGALHSQYQAFQKVLLHDLEQEQFADMYSQTICYGLFAARCHIEDLNLFGDDNQAVFHGQDKNAGQFTREHAAWMLPKTNPFLQRMFNEIAGPGLPQQISWLVDDIVALLRNCQMDKILKGFARQAGKKDPVIHFYETFLSEYDQNLRQARGVYYTPEPVVSFIVRSVDLILKQKFGLKKGLADDSKIKLDGRLDGTNARTNDIHKVLILDPAAGTGTFLYEVIEQIYNNFKSNKGQWSGYVKKHLLPRIYGFELMMAPYTIAHMKLGLQLADKGYDFDGDERIRVFLTNTLEEAQELSGLPIFTQWLADEARQANEVKKDLPIMIVLGNPPYSYDSENNGKWITDLVRDYYQCDNKPLGEKNPKGLQDDYVKFIRFAQYRIQQTGYGVLAFITNHGYLDNPTFRGMRQNLMNTFNDIYILDLHGNTKRKETCPDGSKDVNVFDIQQGVSINIFVKYKDNKGKANIYHCDLFGTRDFKYNWLNSQDINSTKWQQSKPITPFYLFNPQDTKLLKQYNSYWKIDKIFIENATGLKTHRDNLTVAFNYSELQQKINDIIDLSKSDDYISAKYSLISSKSWNLNEARKKLFNEKNIHQFITNCLYRPFDNRSIFFNDNLIERPRKEIMYHMLSGSNLGLLATRQVTSLNYCHITCTKTIIEMKTCSHDRGTNLFPLYLYPKHPNKKQDLFVGDSNESPQSRKANLSDEFISALEQSSGFDYIPDGRGDCKKCFGPEDVLGYIYAILHSRQYRSKYAEFLKIDFPRIPLPDDKQMFADFARIGNRLIKLHLLEDDCLTDENETAKFPIVGSSEVLAGYPKFVCDSCSQDKARVYINQQQYFINVPENVWQFCIGGYQVCDKWLKDRRGRVLSYDEIEHYRKIVLAIAQTIKLMDKIDDLQCSPNPQTS